jgi:hypothetical protein
VKDDVGIAVARKPAAVRYLDAAQHDRPITGKGVNIEARAGPRTETACKPLLGAPEITRQCEFFEGWIALDSGHFHARCTKDAGLIGGRGTGPAFIGGPQSIKPECLRCLDSNHSASIDEFVETLAKARERVADGKYGRRSVMEFEAR